MRLGAFISPAMNYPHLKSSRGFKRNRFTAQKNLGQKYGVHKSTNSHGILHFCGCSHFIPLCDNAEPKGLKIGIDSKICEVAVSK